MIDNPSFRAPTPDEINEMRADLVAAHAHIGALHDTLNSLFEKLPQLADGFALTGELRTVYELVASWEDSQCL